MKKTAGKNSCQANNRPPDIKTSSKGDRIGFLFFIASLSFLAFLGGMGVAHLKYFPYPQFRDGYHSLKPLLKPLREHHLSPVRYDYSGVKCSNPQSVAKGVTLITSYFDEIAGIRIIDHQGKILHTWKTNPADIWPESPYKDRDTGAKNRKDNYIHGSYLFENGDILFNIEYMGLVRMDSAGRVLWKLPERTHHSVTRDEKGNFWVCAMRWIEDGTSVEARKFPGFITPFSEDYIIKVSPDGKILSEISVLEMLMKSGDYRLAWKKGCRSHDVLHLNDVEPLPEELAAEYPLFEAGDLVVSMRTISAVAVLDRHDGHVKWLDSDLATRQHDPDFIGNGWIRVFDNNSEGTNRSKWLGGSRIIDIQPHTGKTRMVYPAPNSTAEFYTDAGGKAQNLANGNLLITESRAGRIFEVDSYGQTVWEWVQEPSKTDPSLVDEVLEGTRYPYTEEKVGSWISPR